MVELKPRSAELFQELVDEGMETGQFEIDSMRYGQMELLGHGLGKRGFRDRCNRRSPSGKDNAWPWGLPAPRVGGSVQPSNSPSR